MAPVLGVAVRAIKYNRRGYQSWTFFALAQSRVRARFSRNHMFFGGSFI